jgi:hypothetical protein
VRRRMVVGRGQRRAPTRGGVRRSASQPVRRRRVGRPWGGMGKEAQEDTHEDAEAEAAEEAEAAP